jgi:hypothetical protein
MDKLKIWINKKTKEFHEDAEDLAAFKERRHEPDLPFEDVLKNLKLS